MILKFPEPGGRQETGRAKTTGTPVPVVDHSPNHSGLPTPAPNLLGVIRAYEQRFDDSPTASAKGLLTTSFELLCRVVGEGEALVYAEAFLASIRQPDGAA